MFDLNNADFLAIERELCARSFQNYVKRAWRVVEPSRQLKWGWALDAISDHLMAAARGQIKRLLINVPPGCMKSLLTGVMLPSYIWGPMGRRSERFLSTAHKLDLAIRDNQKCRNIIKSEWYQKLWPIEIRHDQDQKTKFENVYTGFREAMAFQSLTGSRGDIAILDDPISVDGAESEVELEAVRKTFTETLPTRLNSQEDSVIIVIMQRVHDLDPSGVILELGLPYEHLMLPMRFEEDRRCYTSIGFVDPRVEDGELLFPELFPEKSVQELETTMGGPESYAAAGQLQQRPAPRGGGLFKKEWFTNDHFLKECPKLVRSVRGWDLAGTKKKRSAFTAGVKIGIDAKKRVIIADGRRKKGSPNEVDNLVLSVAKSDGKGVRISLPQDPGQAGTAQANAFAKLLMGYPFECTPETGSKETRAAPLASQAEAGNVYFVDGPWVQDFLNEAYTFPVGRYKDQIDAASRAFAKLMSMSNYNLDNVG